ncbi:ribosomal-processing cysteine protease Prp [Cohnella faecalis]|uniref:Ribosomal processing cysteine protease Prp n=1 Tax=Cohnella faecalis TaxID=2315694 RepID=A0A398CCT4_9BACL|nr:ribosomal-processing cysteine protease Prp [Cohnella faecalis]RIE00513.1 cysteine protease [Cohnella faecalis]
MITVTIVRSAEGRIRRFSIAGHANYDKIGKDIVCAGVSAVTVGAVNAIEKLTGFVPEATIRSGWLTAQFPICEEAAREANVQLLLEGMVVALETIVDEYGKYVRIQQSE